MIITHFLTLILLFFLLCSQWSPVFRLRGEAFDWEREDCSHQCKILPIISLHVHPSINDCKLVTMEASLLSSCSGLDNNKMASPLTSPSLCSYVDKERSIPCIMYAEHLVSEAPSDSRTTFRDGLLCTVTRSQQSSNTDWTHCYSSLHCIPKSIGIPHKARVISAALTKLVKYSHMYAILGLLVSFTLDPLDVSDL